MSSGLMRRFSNGDADADAVREIYDKYGKAVFTVALSALGDRGLAEEAVQQTFLRPGGLPEGSTPLVSPRRGCTPSPGASPSTSTVANGATGADYRSMARRTSRRFRSRSNKHGKRGKCDSPSTRCRQICAPSSKQPTIWVSPMKRRPESSGCPSERSNRDRTAPTEDSLPYSPTSRRQRHEM